MNESIKNFSIKLVLTIPAILLGILSAILFIFKPLIELWKPKQKLPIYIPQESIIEDRIEDHDFH